MIEAPLACIGYVMVELIHLSPLTALFVLAPIVLIYQAFMLPKTQDEAIQALESVNLNLKNANLSIQQLNDELFVTLAKIFDARDPYVGVTRLRWPPMPSPLPRRWGCRRNA